MRLLWTYSVHLQVLMMLVRLLTPWKRSLMFTELENWRTSLVHSE